MTDLLPCPFCGGQAYTVERGIYGWSIECDTPFCPCSFASYRDKAEAIAAWNTRYHSAFEKAVMKAWEEIKSYQERTCKPVETDGVMRCSECDYPLGIISVPAFCAGCGAKVVGE